MTHEILLEEYLETGEGQIVGRLEQGDYLIGREPDYGIALDRTSISRNHGKFLRVKNHWLYKDLGSTNGSWLNGNPLRGDTWRIIRPGDYLQLADVALQLRYDADGTTGAGLGEFQSLSGRTLLLFQGNDEFVDEYPVPEYGKALVIGGSQGQFEIPGDTSDSPSLVIERRGDDVVVYSVSKTLPVLCDGMPIEDTQPLTDGACVVVATYTVVLNDPAERGSSETTVTEKGDVNIAGVSNWGDGAQGPDLGSRPTFEPSRATSGGVLSTFGRSIDEDAFESDTSTIAIDRDQIGTSTLVRDRHPSSRYMYEEEQYPVTTTEDKIILALGIFMIFMLFGLALWWFL